MAWPAAVHAPDSGNMHRASTTLAPRHGSEVGERRQRGYGAHGAARVVGWYRQRQLDVAQLIVVITLLVSPCISLSKLAR